MSWTLLNLATALRLSTCRYEVFNDHHAGPRWMSTADSKVSLVFGNSSTDVFVTSVAEKTGELRTLLKRIGSGVCKEASNVMCDRVEEGKTKIAIGSGLDMCYAHRCLFDKSSVDLPDSLFRIMAAGAFSNLRTTSGQPKVLNIGHGAGTLPVWLLHVLDVRVESVDLDADVIRAAPCFGLFPSPALQLTVADGRTALEQHASGSLALIFVDVFAPPQPDSQAETPCSFRTLEFFQAAYEKLDDGGRLVMNVWPEYLPEVVPAAVSAWTGDGHVYIGEVPPPFGNTVLVATKPVDQRHSARELMWRLPSAPKSIAMWYKEASWTRVGLAQGDIVPRDSTICQKR